MEKSYISVVVGAMDSADRVIAILNRRGTTAERHERELKHLRILYTRFSEARRESFCPLDTDLSWMVG